ncbi:FeoB-associated Cys-rich membrane protein [Pedobacter heparinus]|uniref:FeoB-associated Cys-rich membrane protein n=1 Tax=Pedobacter heparinus TaxID=984 RepID=UPI00292E4EED|nr:FeoB-associated Cys-rich membrane protein [Pedobacter heparinus]
MDSQTILVAILFAAALFYLGRIIYRALTPKSGGCASNCGKCSVDFSNIEPDKNRS